MQKIPSLPTCAFCAESLTPDDHLIADFTDKTAYMVCDWSCADALALAWNTPLLPYTIALPILDAQNCPQSIFSTYPMQSAGQEEKTILALSSSEKHAMTLFDAAYQKMDQALHGSSMAVEALSVSPMCLCSCDVCNAPLGDLDGLILETAGDTVNLLVCSPACYRLAEKSLASFVLPTSTMSDRLIDYFFPVSLISLGVVLLLCTILAIGSF